MRSNFLLYIFFLFNLLFLIFNKKNENFYNLKNNKEFLEITLYNFFFNLILKNNIRAFELIPKFISEFEFKNDYVNYNKKILKKILKNNKKILNNKIINTEINSFILEFNKNLILNKNFFQILFCNDINSIISNFIKSNKFLLKIIFNSEYKDKFKNYKVMTINLFKQFLNKNLNKKYLFSKYDILKFSTFLSANFENKENNIFEKISNLTKNYLKKLNLNENYYFLKKTNLNVKIL